MEELGQAFPLQQFLVDGVKYTHRTPVCQIITNLLRVYYLCNITSFSEGRVCHCYKLPKVDLYIQVCMMLGQKHMIAQHIHSATVRLNTLNLSMNFSVTLSLTEGYGV